MKTNHQIRLYLTGIMNDMACVDVEQIEKAIDILRTARIDKSNVWIIGNGGSAATTSHFANDLLKMGGIRAFSVPDMTPTTLAYGNDNGWKYMFVDPISKLYEPNDVLFAISCSGNSENIVACLDYIGNRVILLTGNDHESKAVKMEPQVIIFTESDEITKQETIHSAVCHVIAKVLSGEM